MKAIIAKEGLTIYHLPNFVRNDYGYSVVFSIRYENDDKVDLTGGTVKFKLKSINETVEKVNRSCTIDNPTNGICSYKPAIQDLDTHGVFNAELEVITGGGLVINTIPLGKVSILEDI